MNIKIKKNENIVEIKSLEHSLIQDKKEFKNISRI